MAALPGYDDTKGDHDDAKSTAKKTESFFMGDGDRHLNNDNDVNFPVLVVDGHEFPTTSLDKAVTWLSDRTPLFSLYSITTEQVIGIYIYI